MLVLRQLQAGYEQIYTEGRLPITALGPAPPHWPAFPWLPRHHPGAAVVWLHAHADLNTPTTRPPDSRVVCR